MLAEIQLTTTMFFSSHTSQIHHMVACESWILYYWILSSPPTELHVSIVRLTQSHQLSDTLGQILVEVLSRYDLTSSFVSLQLCVNTFKYQKPIQVLWFPPQFWHTIQIISTLKRPDFHNFSVFFFGLSQWRTWNMNLTLPEIGLKM